ncbi:hypothetical protein MASR2M15_07810 [Anaerolineales bacterium]
MNGLIYTLMGGLRSKLSIRGENGQGMVEYALILVLVAVVVIVALALIGPSLKNQWYEPVINAIATVSP